MAAHAYPVMLEPDGKALGTGEFSQQIEDGLLRIEITYKLKNGVRIQEKAAFQQRPELIQKEWSWRERKGDELQREFTVDFDSARASAQKREEDGLKNWLEAVEIEPGRTFAGFGFVLALQNLRDRLVRARRSSSKVSAAPQAAGRNGQAQFPRPRPNADVGPRTARRSFPDPAADPAGGEVLRQDFRYPYLAHSAARRFYAGRAPWLNRAADSSDACRRSRLRGKAS
ncbi:MAG: hypothetical protein M3Q86_07370 [Verrucomicrobiota bacterium]|nr:hypothetical protein [Verrucomicrobiota bacterium]